MKIDLEKLEALSLVHIYLEYFDKESFSELDEVAMCQATLDKLTKAAGKPRIDLYKRNLENFDKGL